jgi:hypothetical protein
MPQCPQASCLETAEETNLIICHQQGSHYEEHTVLVKAFNLLFRRVLRGLFEERFRKLLDGGEELPG